MAAAGVSFGWALRVWEEDGSCGAREVSHGGGVQSSEDTSGSCFSEGSTAFDEFVVAGLFAVYSLMVFLLDTMELSAKFCFMNEEPSELDFETHDAAEMPGLIVFCEVKSD